MTDLATIARESHLGEFETTKVCFQLLHSDWVTVRPDKSFRLDVRLVLLTDDGALIHRLTSPRQIGRAHV